METIVTERDKHHQRKALQSAPWGYIWAALAISILGTGLFGGILFLIDQNIWWVALAGVDFLIIGGFYIGWRSGESEPLYGALLAILYFGLVLAILFVGTLLEALPDPLPGLSIGDSTFYFVLPLLQLVGGLMGSLAGGRISNGLNGRG